MNDLISRTSLLKTLNDWWLSETPNGRVLLIGGELQRTPAMKDIEQFMMMVENVPTAYDIDKVAKQLEDKAMKWESVHSQGGLIDLDKAVEIVKKGGSDG